jgi:hypothetical protein
MKIICAGVRRSGSTWLYNVILSAIENDCKNLKFQFIKSNDKFQWSNEGHEVIKIHHFDEKICNSADLIFTTKRNWLDIAASAVRRETLVVDNFLRLEFKKNHEKDIKNFILNEIKNYKNWKKFSCMEVCYKSIIKNELNTIKDICEKLKVKNKSEFEIKNKLDNIKPPENKLYDKDTQLWQNHITDGGYLTYHKTLPKEIIFVLNKIIKKELVYLY